MSQNRLKYLDRSNLTDNYLDAYRRISKYTLKTEQDARGALLYHRPEPGRRRKIGNIDELALCYLFNPTNNWSSDTEVLSGINPDEERRPEVIS